VPNIEELLRRAMAEASLITCPARVSPSADETSPRDRVELAYRMLKRLFRKWIETIREIEADIEITQKGSTARLELAQAVQVEGQSVNIWAE
jgi:hypothetical protein